MVIVQERYDHLPIEGCGDLPVSMAFLMNRRQRSTYRCRMRNTVGSLQNRV